MAKAKTTYACTECGGQAPKWQGQCPNCNAWNTLVEIAAAATSTRFENVAGVRSQVISLAAVTPRASSRVATGLEEFDRVLGGGLVPGAVVAPRRMPYVFRSLLP